MARRIGIRDTAKDIMLGTAPSGPGPKMLRETAARLPPPRRQPQARADTSFRRPPVLPPAAVPPPDPTPIMDPTVIARLSSAERSNRSLMEEIMQLRNDFRNFQRQAADALTQEQEARRRLEATLKAIADSHARTIEGLRTNQNGDGYLTKQELDESKRTRTQLAVDLFRTQQDLSYLKGIVDQQANDLLMLNSELKSRPVIDPVNMNSTQHLEANIRDVHGQIMNLRQAVDNEIEQRRRIDQEQQSNLKNLQTQMLEHEARKNEILKALAAQENSKNNMNEETKRLNAKIGLITDEVTRNLMVKEQQLRDEYSQSYLILEKAIKAELESRLRFERDVKMYVDSRGRQYQEQMENIQQQTAIEKQKQKLRMTKANERLSILERHLEQGNRKVDRVLAAEIESRRLNEKALLTKLGDIEDRLTGHVGHINGALDDVKRGMIVEPPPPVDTDALRNELEAIASDKHKLSMEGLLKLEERLNRIHQSMERDTKELNDKLNNLEHDHHNFKNTSEPRHKAYEETRQLDQDSLARIRHQIQKLDDAQNEVSRAHDKMKERVDYQIPKDLEELDLKTKQRHDQLHQRVENEERERHIAVRDLQDEITKLKNRPTRSLGNTPGASGPGPDIHQHINEKLQREMDECQVGIKKLAESVTTVKNVLERRITEEARIRERELDEVHKRIDSIHE